MHLLNEDWLRYAIEQDDSSCYCYMLYLFHGSVHRLAACKFLGFSDHFGVHTSYFISVGCCVFLNIIVCLCLALRVCELVLWFCLWWNRVFIWWIGFAKTETNFHHSLCLRFSFIYAFRNVSLNVFRFWNLSLNIFNKPEK